MHRALKRTVLSFLVLYAAFWFHTFLGGWLPVGLPRPELDLLVLGGYALQGSLLQAALLGYWDGLLRDSLTQGRPGGWTISLLVFSWALALWARDRRVGITKKTLLLFGGLLGCHVLFFFLEGKGGGGGELYLQLFFRILLPSALLTAAPFPFGIRFFQKWLSGSGSTQTDR